MIMDIMRTDDANALTSEPNAKTAVLYTVAYLYEHREDADHHDYGQRCNTRWRCKKR